MGFLEVVILGIGLAMDAFAVSICKGLSMNKVKWKNVLIIALYFGAFQAFMPMLGYFLGTSFSSFVKAIDHWIAFCLLTIIGGNMIREWKDRDDDKKTDEVGFRTMLPLAVATSIDALAVGITLAFLEENVFWDGAIIGGVTFFVSGMGVLLGKKFGDRFQNTAKLLGGIVLILIGVKILLEHLGIWK